jgi:hypothetical protein
MRTCMAGFPVTTTEDQHPSNHHDLTWSSQNFPLRRDDLYCSASFFRFLELAEAYNRLYSRRASPACCALSAYAILQTGSYGIRFSGMAAVESGNPLLLLAA